jgi:hypothetical protein
MTDEQREAFERSMRAGPDPAEQEWDAETTGREVHDGNQFPTSSTESATSATNANGAAKTQTKAEDRPLTDQEASSLMARGTAKGIKLGPLLQLVFDETGHSIQGFDEVLLSELPRIDAAIERKGTAA